MTGNTGVDLGSGNTSGNPGNTGVTVDPQTGNAGNNGGGDPWYKPLAKDPDAIKTISDKGWSSVDGIVKSYNELQSAYSSKAGSGAPKTAAEYDFKPPAGLPANAYSKELAEGFKSVAHKAGLSKESAAALHDWYAEQTSAAITAATNGQSTKLNERVEGTMAALTKEWGQMDSPVFKRNVDLAKRSMDKLEPGLKDALVEVGAIARVNGVETVTNPTIFKALAKIGNALYAEDTLHGTPAETNNPFDPKTANMMEQSRLIKEAPDKARLLIQAAGPEVQRMYAHFLNRK